ncbi:MAG: hypothetical protein ABIN67_03195 [Ferruginibacter sp.]
MKKVLSVLLFCLFLTQTFGQNNKKISAYLLTQYNKTIYDQTLGNNSWAIGFGLQAFINTKTKFRPTIELTADGYLVDDKVFRTGLNGKELEAVGVMTNLFVGTSYEVADNFFVSIVAGPSFLSGQTLLGVKPSLGVHFSKNKKVTAKLSYINIFNRGQTKEDFGSLSLAIGVRLF